MNDASTPAPANMFSAADEETALEQLHASKSTDGLPVVIPTPERVQRMVLATGMDGDLVLGEMGPMWGAATVHKVAIAAVMAGCLPDYAPVVVATIRAVLKPEFDLAEMQGTTHVTAPLVIINGPAREAAGGIASGFGALGPGHRANASIGRALRLAMINIGGAWPGESDMALHGHPGKFTYCLAEDEDHSPFPPLHTTFGYDANQSAVTVVGAEAPHSVIFTGDADDPASADHYLNALAGVIANTGSNNAFLGGDGAVVVVMNPDHGRVLTRAGYSRQYVQQRLAELATNPRKRLMQINPKMLRAEEEFVPAVRDPERIHLLTAGGGGLYSLVMPSWCAGPHQNSAVHAEIELGAFCEVPGASQ
jgi:hypothetical protein